ncbi:winged helix-turn-helix transcriptional regulator [Lactococcus hircilactis]
MPKRKVLPTNPPQVEYTLTGKGTALKPIFDLLNLWHEKYHA